MRGLASGPRAGLLNTARTTIINEREQVATGDQQDQKTANQDNSQRQETRSVRMITFNSLFKRTLKFHSFGDLTFGRGIPWPQMLGFVVTWLVLMAFVNGRLGFVDAVGLSTCLAALVTFVISHVAMFGRNPFLELWAIAKHLLGPKHYLGMRVLKRPLLTGFFRPSIEERRLKAMIAREKELHNSGRTRPVDRVVGELKETGLSVMRNHRWRRLRDGD